MKTLVITLSALILFNANGSYAALGDFCYSIDGNEPVCLTPLEACRFFSGKDRVYCGETDLILEIQKLGYKV